MRIVFDPRAADDLVSQIDYLIKHDALQAAIRLEKRCNAFFEEFLARHPRTGKHIATRDIWEAWMPGTRLVIWYRFTDTDLQIIRIWHVAQDRAES
jgi:plasmid stabilization system protein ParE